MRRSIWIPLVCVAILGSTLIAGLEMGFRLARPGAEAITVISKVDRTSSHVQDAVKQDAVKEAVKEVKEAVKEEAHIPLPIEIPKLQLPDLELNPIQAPAKFILEPMEMPKKVAIAKPTNFEVKIYPVGDFPEIAVLLREVLLTKSGEWAKAEFFPATDSLVVCDSPEHQKLLAEIMPVVAREKSISAKKIVILRKAYELAASTKSVSEAKKLAMKILDIDPIHFANLALNSKGDESNEPEILQTGLLLPHEVKKNDSPHIELATPKGFDDPEFLILKNAFEKNLEANIKASSSATAMPTVPTLPKLEIEK